MWARAPSPPTRLSEFTKLRHAGSGNCNKGSVTATNVDPASPETIPDLVLVLTIALIVTTRASVDDAQSFALQAAEPYVKEGFQVREDYWGGDLGVGEKKASASII